MRHLKVYLLLLSLWVYPLTSATETLKIVTPLWTGWTNTDGSGFYFDLANELFGKLGYEIEWQAVPYKRARVMVTSGTADAMFGVLNQDFYEKAIITPAYPIDIGQYAALFKKTFPWQGIQSFENQKVAMPLGYLIEQHLPDAFHRVSVKDTAMGIRMLMADRVNLFVSDHDEILAALKTQPLDMSLYQIEIISHHNLYMGFANNSKGKDLRSIYDREISKLIGNNAIEALYIKYDHPVNILKPDTEIVKLEPESAHDIDKKHIDLTAVDPLEKNNIKATDTRLKRLIK